MPAFCDTCGTIFNSGFYVENSIDVTFKGNTSGPCPKCGGWGHVPDGIYNFVDNVIKVLSAPERTIAELSRLAEILQEAKAKAETREQVVSLVEREAPFFANVVKLLPENKGELYNFLTLVSAALTLVLAAVSLAVQLGSPSAPTSSSTMITVNQVIQRVIIDQPAIKQHTPKPEKKIGRNERCSCGSGRKYKRCCGKLK